MLVVCSDCLTELMYLEGLARGAFWDGLPRMYGVQGWAELEQLKAAAIGAF